LAREALLAVGQGQKGWAARGGQVVVSQSKALEATCVEWRSLLRNWKAL